MKSNLNTQEYNYDYSNERIPFNIKNNKNINSARLRRNNSYKLQKHNQYQLENSSQPITDRLNTHNSNKKENNINTFNNNNNNSNKFRINNLEERILSLEKMLQYLDEFIHLKEEEKTNNHNNNSIIIEPLVSKINSLEYEIKNLKKEKEENKKIITELNNKIACLEKKMDNYNYSGMQDIIYSLSDKEKKLNMLINDFSDLSKDANKMINSKMNEKINEFNIFNENRINELLLLIQDINKIIEENEIKVNKVNESIHTVEKDNLNIIKVISIQEQKLNSFDLIINEINNIKEKFYLLMNDYNFNNKIEENLKDNLKINFLK